MRGEVGELKLGWIGVGLLDMLPRRAAGLAATSEVTPARAMQHGFMRGNRCVSDAMAAARLSTGVVSIGKKIFYLVKKGKIDILVPQL